MPTFRICLTNTSFSVDEEQECAGLEDAKRKALKGALEIGTEQALGGKQFFAAEARVEQDQMVLARFMVIVGSSSLIL